MPDFQEHINKANNNLLFLQRNNPHADFWDWQVTICFYTCLHVINAHLAKCNNSHYRTHTQVEQAINPFYNKSKTKISQDVFVAYSSLFKLSRRARYMVNENAKDKGAGPYFTHDRHFVKAIKRTDMILGYFSKKYGVTFENIKIKFPNELRSAGMLNITYA